MFVKNAMGVLIENTFESVHCYGRLIVFTLVILLIHEHGMSFHFLVSVCLSPEIWSCDTYDPQQ